MANGDLSAKEQSLYLEWLEKKTKPSLSPSLSTQLFQLFLNGYSCDEICEHHNKIYPIGQILEARVRDEWDRRRKEHLDQLYSKVFDRVKQTQFESVAFTSDLLAAAHKLYGQKIKTFLETGKEDDLGEAQGLIKSLDAYRKVAEMLLKLTGQDKSKEANLKIQAVSSPATTGAITDVVAEVINDEQKRLEAGTPVFTSDLAYRVLTELGVKEE